ncbi:hypothetical protein KAW18_11620 [candidate division WOR-3 bacterium]|nr:hypothetical protein [candidate division WOR-3 bacterium]
MTNEITMDYPDDGSLKTFPVGMSIIDFVNGVVKLADGTKDDLPYKLSDYDHDHMSYLYLTTGEKITIETDELGERTILGTTKIKTNFKYIYITTISATPVSFFVSTDPDASLDISDAETDIELITTIEYDTDDDPVYIGEAAPSTLKSASLWRIKKITYDGSKNPTDIQYAYGTQTFTKVWDNRTTYSYS